MILATNPVSIAWNIDLLSGYRYDFLTGSRRRGSQCLGSLARWLRAEVDAYMAQFADERDENGRRLVVRNGSHQSCEVLTSGISHLQESPRPFATALSPGGWLDGAHMYDRCELASQPRLQVECSNRPH